MANKFTKYLCLALALVMSFAFLLTLSPIEVKAADATYSVDGDDELEILAIGNSFTEDTLTHFYAMAQSLGIENIYVSYLFYSGASLENHVSFAKKESTSYTYKYISSSGDGAWHSSSNYTSKKALTARTWDYVMLQETSGRSGVASHYETYLGTLVDYVKANVNSEAKIIWNMTWAYAKDYENSTYTKNYDADQMTMYNAITSVTQEYVLTNPDIDIISPAGTAIQNARTGWYGDNYDRDGYHLHMQRGRYIAALTLLASITDLDLSNANATGIVNDLEHRISLETVENAVNNPFEVTESFYKKSNYEKYVPEITIGKYWNSTSQTNYNVLMSSSTSVATERFTKNEIPENSILQFDSGWYHRPEGWVTDEPQASRPEQIKATYVVVTEEWWGDYTIRALNISKGSTKLTSMTPEEIYDVFTIYVPKQTEHTHNYATNITPPTCEAEGYTTYTCACGDSYVSDNTDALGHTEVTDKAVAPTCTETGLTEGKHCSVCNVVLEEQSEVKALGHTEVTDKAVAPTCTETGLTEGKHCSVCNVVLEEQSEVKALGHTEVTDKAVAPTCTETGLTEGKHCSVCNVVLEEQSEVKALGHTDESVVTKPTCTEAGYTTYTCTVCGDVRTGDEVSALGHTKGATVQENVVAPDCVNTGSLDEVIYCTACSVEMSRDTLTIEARGHNGGTATCFNPKICDDCGASYGDPLTHSFENYIYNGDATCTEDGTMTAYCENGCGTHDTVTSSGSALGHDWNEATVDAPKTCKNCGETEGEKLTPPAPDVSVENDHEACEDNVFKTILNIIINFLRRLFGLPEKCICGKEI